MNSPATKGRRRDQQPAGDHLMTVEQHLERIKRANSLDDLSRVANYADWLIENERIPNADEHKQIMDAIAARREYILKIAGTP